MLTYLKETDGLSVEGISEQNMGSLNVYCGLKSIKLNDLMVVMIRDFINQQSTDKMYTDTSLLENVVNSSQVSGLQTYTNVYSDVYKPVYSRIQHNSQKTVNSVNRQKALENIGKMGIKEMLSVQLCSNAGKVID